MHDDQANVKLWCFDSIYMISGCFKLLLLLLLLVSLSAIAVLAGHLCCSHAKKSFSMFAEWSVFKKYADHRWKLWFASKSWTLHNKIHKWSAYSRPRFNQFNLWTNLSLSETRRTLTILAIHSRYAFSTKISIYFTICLSHFSSSLFLLKILKAKIKSSLPTFLSPFVCILPCYPLFICLLVDVILQMMLPTEFEYHTLCW